MNPPFSSYLDVSVGSQQLALIVDGRIEQRFPVSTAKNGVGQQRGSYRTPLGWHQIRAKIGGGAPLHAVFKGRRPTGEIYCAALAQTTPERDWILTRILWLSGLEPGRNRYRDVDSAWRFIYIHGSPDEEFDGSPKSHGCVRMRNADIRTLFDAVPCRFPVLIRL